MASPAIALNDVLPLSSVAVLLMPALIVVLSAIVVTLGVLLSRVVVASSAVLWAWMQALPSQGAGRMPRLPLGRFGIPCR